MHHHMLALLHRRNGNRRVQMVRRHHLHRVHVLLLFQQLPEVRISRAPAELLRAPFGRIIGLDEFLGHVPAPGMPGAPRRQSGFPSASASSARRPSFDQSTYSLLSLTGSHTATTCTSASPAGPAIPATLRAAPDVGHGNLLARRHKTPPAQHPPRHNRKRRRRRRPARRNELPPGNPRRTGLIARLACFHPPSLT